jgi:hypothetical protein
MLSTATTTTEYRLQVQQLLSQPSEKLPQELVLRASEPVTIGTAPGDTLSLQQHNVMLAELVRSADQKQLCLRVHCESLIRSQSKSLAPRSEHYFDQSNWQQQSWDIAGRVNLQIDDLQYWNNGVVLSCRLKLSDKRHPEKHVKMVEVKARKPVTIGVGPQMHINILSLRDTATLGRLFLQQDGSPALEVYRNHLFQHDGHNVREKSVLTLDLQRSVLLPSFALRLKFLVSPSLPEPQQPDSVVLEPVEQIEVDYTAAAASPTTEQMSCDSDEHSAGDLTQKPSLSLKMDLEAPRRIKRVKQRSGLIKDFGYKSYRGVSVNHRFQQECQELEPFVSVGLCTRQRARDYQKHWQEVESVSATPSNDEQDDEQSCDLMTI